MTSVPTSPPSLTGWVASIVASTTVTATVSPVELDGYSQSVADFYGVDASDVSTAVVYSTGGSLTVSIPDDVSSEEFAVVMQSSLAESLGVHPQNVEVSVDMETGEVTFTISSEDFDLVSEAQFQLESDSVQQALVASIAENLPSAEVTNIDVSPEISASLEFTIDADEATNDLTQAAWQTEQLLSADFVVTVESKRFERVHANRVVRFVRNYGTHLFPQFCTYDFAPYSSTLYHRSCGCCRTPKDGYFFA